MSPLISKDARIANLPPEQFYWAVLDASALGSEGGRVTTQQLGYLFESVLPVPIEQLQATYLKHLNGSNAYIACGMQRDRLQQWIDTQSEEPISLTPIETPQFVCEQLGTTADKLDTSTLNLLGGEFEPPTVTGLRRRWITHSVAAFLVLAMLTVIGLERRTSTLHENTATIQAARTNAIIKVLDLSSGARGNPELLLTAELRTLRQTRHQPLRSNLTETDCSITLANVLANWPDNLHVQTESLVIAPASITFRGIAPTSSVIQSLADSLQRLGGWSVQQPQISASRDVVQATIQLKQSATTANAMVDGGAS